jgi:hypothetical protein
MDEGYFTVESTEIEQEKACVEEVPQENVAVMAESTPLEYRTGENIKSCRYFKIARSHTAEGINETIRKSIEESSIVFTSQDTSYVDITCF